MNKTVHLIYRNTLLAIVIAVTCYLGYIGYSYYDLPLEERFYHPEHDWFKPSGIYGHGLGIMGTLMILFGVSIYIARKRYNFMAKYLQLKYLLEFHIFLCTLGPVLVLYHTAFKFGGIVSVAFWSMVAVVLSGVIGRFIYIQIPRTIEGRELSLNEVRSMQQELTTTLLEVASGDPELESFAKTLAEESEQQKSDRNTFNELKRLLVSKKIDRPKRKKMIKLVRNEITLNKRIDRLQTMQKLFKYWHVAHLPFALIMLIIVVIHVAVTLAFGYKWVF